MIGSRTSDNSVALPSNRASNDHIASKLPRGGVKTDATDFPLQLQPRAENPPQGKSGLRAIWSAHARLMCVRTMWFIFCVF